MVRQSLFGLAVVALGFARDPGCGGVDDPQGGPNAPCTRSSDCGGDLQCREGVCREVDASAPPRDSGADSSDAGDDGG